MAIALKLLRNTTTYANRGEALQKLKSKLNGSTNQGEAMIATYTSGDTEKILLGITGIGNGYEIFEGASFDEEGNLLLPTAVQEAINKILANTVTSITKEGDYITVVDNDAAIEDKQLKLNYASHLNDALKVPDAVGDIVANETVGTLKNKTYGELFDMILFPIKYPTVVEPSTSISFKNGFSSNGIYEVGAVAPKVDNFNTVLNQGVCIVATQDNKNRAGSLNAADSFIYYGGVENNKTLPEKIVLGVMQYNYHAAYNEGEMLITSRAEKAEHDINGNQITENPLTAGSVNSKDLFIYGTYPCFCNGQNANTSSAEGSLPTAVTPDTKLPLIKWSDTLIAAKFASEAATGIRLIFDFPAAKNVAKVEFMNTVSGKWETYSESNYKVEATAAKSVQGIDVEYKRLTTQGSLSGALQLRFTLVNA